MNFFKYRQKELFAENVSLRELAEIYGTPLYVYSENTLIRHLNAYQNAFKDYPHLICFSLKSNPNLSILRLLGKGGAGADIVSGGELYRALKAGISTNKIVYAGVGKTDNEIRYALKSNILMFNVESEDELRRIDSLAATMKVKAPIALRINPDIDPQTHPYISTGMKEHKFGISIDKALEHYRLAARLKNIRVIGIHKHIGSQLTKISPFVDSLSRILLLVDRLSSDGVHISYLNIGGGLGITYKEEIPPQPRELAKSIIPLLKGRKLTLIMEPGRSILGNAGVLLTKCLYLKKGQDKNFIIVDAGMNDLIRPTLYNAYHDIMPIAKRRGLKVHADVVGPICESGDFLAKAREIILPRRDDYLAVMSSGAYGFSMSSNYNSRPRAAEVMVNGNKHRLIRRRETYADLIKGE